MKPAFEDTLIEVWRQAFAGNAKDVVLGTERYPIVRTPKRKLRQVDFRFEGKEIHGLEQNPNTKSRWAAMARAGKNVMPFLVEGRYVANVAGGKATLYSTARLSVAGLEPVSCSFEGQRFTFRRSQEYGRI
jgi:hypothetical protein